MINNKNLPKVYACVPVLNESEHIFDFIADFLAQEYPFLHLLVCVNQPDEWWDLPGKVHVCHDNQKVLRILENSGLQNLTLIDKSSRGKGWLGKKHGVGYARKTVMDAASELASAGDIILSMDADTRYTNNYVAAVVEALMQQHDVTGLSVPYYHSLTGNEAADRSVLRYEIYMRNYALNMLRISNPYAFSAIGSGMACTAGTYRRVGGLSPRMSGEDFYFILKLRKAGNIMVNCSQEIFPAARFSDRVYFGTGPAMIKGNTGDWGSYPVYRSSDFDKISETFAAFGQMFAADLPLPVDDFLRCSGETGSFWEALRANSGSKEVFVKACQHRFDALRILQFLKAENTKQQSNEPDYSDEKNLKIFFESKFFADEERAGIPVFDNFATCSVQDLDKIRNTMFNKERLIQKQIIKV